MAILFSLRPLFRHLHNPKGYVRTLGGNPLFIEAIIPTDINGPITFEVAVRGNPLFIEAIIPT